ncbi:ABC transporter ATP-binding protein [Enterococcus hirae]|nr:ABC transporter ATP-binding protein [Enterococcus hirae]
MTILVKADHLQKKFGKFEALKDVSFEINSGEVLGFIGPNGAGKSTTIRILLGILKASGGVAEVFGKEVWKDSIAIHRRLSYVPGELALWGNMTGGEIIDLLIHLHGNADQGKKKKLIERFELDPRKKAKSYSKGNRQKVGLIAALSVDSDLYILDEPTSGLDPLMENIFQEEIVQLKAEGKSILLSSHILSEVERLADRVAIIREGVVVEQGTLDELRHLTRSTMTLETAGNVEEIKNLPGVHDFILRGHEARFSIDGSAVNSIMEKATALSIKKIEVVPPTLEDLFIRHYESQR